MVRIVLVFLLSPLFLMHPLWAGSSCDWQTTPKAELHLHLGGSYPLEFLLLHASEEQSAQLLHCLDLLSQGVCYHEAFTIFPLIASIVSTDERVAEGTRALCRSLKEDNVRYVEIRTGLKDLGEGFEGYLNAILTVLEEESNGDFEAKTILSVRRSTPCDEVRRTIDLALRYRHRGVVGVDVSGNSTVGNVHNIISELERGRELGLPILLHLGESPDEVGQLEELQRLQPARIGHGVHLCPEAREWVLSHGVPVEVCLTCNVLCGMTESYSTHPALDWYRQMSHPILFCTDDPLLFSTTLSRELELAHTQAGLSEEQIGELSQKAFEYRLGLPQ